MIQIPKSRKVRKPHMREPTGKVITRGQPDMRQPKGFHYLQTSEKSYAPYEHKSFTKGAEQYTIFDEMKMKFDPQTKIESGQTPLVYARPGEEFISRASRRRLSSRQPQHIVTRASYPSVSEKAGPSIDKALGYFGKGEKPTPSGTQEPPKLGGVKGGKKGKGGGVIVVTEEAKPSALDKAKAYGSSFREKAIEGIGKGIEKISDKRAAELKEKSRRYGFQELSPEEKAELTQISIERHQTIPDKEFKLGPKQKPKNVYKPPKRTTKLPDTLPESEVNISSPAYMRKPQRQDYQYLKQVEGDIHKFKTGKAEFKKGKYKRKKR